jgi:hypothetical protein
MQFFRFFLLCILSTISAAEAAPWVRPPGHPSNPKLESAYARESSPQVTSTDQTATFTATLNDSPQSLSRSSSESCTSCTPQQGLETNCYKKNDIQP